MSKFPEGDWRPADVSDNSIGDMRDAVRDHEINPEYELHIGRVLKQEGRDIRCVSIWIAGKRWTGFLTEGED